MTDNDLKKIGVLIENNIAPLKNEVKNLRKDLAGVKTDLAGVKTDLAGVKTDLAGVKKAVGRIEEKVDNPETGLTGLNEKMDILMAEMIEVRKLTKATNELVRLNKELVDQEIREIKKHTGLNP